MGDHPSPLSGIKCNISHSESSNEDRCSDDMKDPGAVSFSVPPIRSSEHQLIDLKGGGKIAWSFFLKGGNYFSLFDPENDGPRQMLFLSYEG